MAVFLLLTGALAHAQSVSQRGFVEGRAALFPQEAPNDREHAVGDLVAREEVFLRPASWIQLAAGADLRANSHDQVRASWRFDAGDRGTRRPALSLRRLSATIARGPFTVDVGKQFIRWGKTDIVTPTDRLAPRDFLNVVDSEFLAVWGARAVVQLKADAIDLVWLPRFTPSRIPLLDQRWTAVPRESGPVTLLDGGAVFPGGSQAGVRWSHTGRGYEYSVAFFDGYNHVPNIDATLLPPALPPEVAIVRRYPAQRMYGGDAAVPTAWFTLKGEVAYFTTSTPGVEEYALFGLQLERQTGEWLLIGGYAGEAVSRRTGATAFAPDRGLSRSVVGRASYTFDANRSGAIEAAIRQNGRGAYAKGEWSQARGSHWRATVTGTLIRGDLGDFLGQYRSNSHLSLALRYSF